MNVFALALSTIGGTVLQVAMVVLGHRQPAVKKWYAVGGMGFSLLAGIAYGALAPAGTMADLATGGALAGGLCGLIGIVVSFRLGDVPWTLMLIGTASSTVTGLLGGAFLRWLTGR